MISPLDFCLGVPSMKFRIALPAILFAGLFALTASQAEARLFGGGCCEPSCCAPEPSCCAPVEPSCCAPEPSCCAPKLRHRCRLFHRLHCCKPVCEPTCCAPEPTCCAPVEPSCCAPEPSCCAPKCCRHRHRVRICKPRCHRKRCCVSACEPSCGVVVEPACGCGG